MASIRRTQSPAYQDRHYQNGGVNSPSHNFVSSSKYYSPSLSSAVAAFAVNFRRKGPQGMRRAFLRCAFFFLIGFLLGMMPFDHTDEEIRGHDFSFDIKPPHVNVRFNDGGGAVAAVKKEEFVVDVRLGIEGAHSESSGDGLVFVPRNQLIVVTPTYNRPLQAYFLNRLGQVLRLVPPPLLWIVVEMNSASMETAEILRKTGVMYRHLACAKNSTEVKDRGVHQRNTALEHIEHHRLDGIVYFADDDNIYSLELFYSLRNIRYLFVLCFSVFWAIGISFLGFIIFVAFFIYINFTLFTSIIVGPLCLQDTP